MWWRLTHLSRGGHGSQRTKCFTLYDVYDIIVPNRMYCVLHLTHTYTRRTESSLWTTEAVQESQVTADVRHLLRCDVRFHVRLIPPPFSLRRLDQPWPRISRKGGKKNRKGVRLLLSFSFSPACGFCCRPHVYITFDELFFGAPLHKHGDRPSRTPSRALLIDKAMIEYTGGERKY
jgi:hypothetical protein